MQTPDQIMCTPHGVQQDSIKGSTARVLITCNHKWSMNRYLLFAIIKWYYVTHTYATNMIKFKLIFTFFKSKVTINNCDKIVRENCVMKLTKH